MCECAYDTKKHTHILHKYISCFFGILSVSLSLEITTEPNAQVFPKCTLKQGETNHFLAHHAKN